MFSDVQYYCYIDYRNIIINIVIMTYNFLYRYIATCKLPLYFLLSFFVCINEQTNG